MTRFYSSETRLTVQSSPLNDKFIIECYLAGNDIWAGRTVEKYDSKEEADSSAEQFFKMAELALLEGYRLENGYFKNNEGKEIDFSHALDKDRTLDEFKIFLNE